MKSKLQIQTPAAILFLILSLAVAPAQTPPPSAPALNPATGLPVAGGVLTIDPATGLPVPPPAPQWIASNWTDPDIVLTNVDFEGGLPLSEVTRFLRARFQDRFNHDSFDVLPMPKTFGKDWGDETIQLQLNNVRASDIFNAMNLVFENDRTPLRWELTQSVTPAHHVNRWVQLRVLPEAAQQPEAATPPPPEKHRMVYFVGNLVGDEKSGGMTMDQLMDTIFGIWPSEFGAPGKVVQFHKDAQLIVANGTREQLEFIHQTLAALEAKAQHDQANRENAERLAAKAEAEANRHMQKTNSAGAK